MREAPNHHSEFICMVPGAALPGWLRQFQVTAEVAVCFLVFSRGYGAEICTSLTFDSPYVVYGDELLATL